MKKVCDIVDILVQYGGVAGGKAMMKVWAVVMWVKAQRHRMTK